MEGAEKTTKLQKQFPNSFGHSRWTNNTSEHVGINCSCSASFNTQQLLTGTSQPALQKGRTFGLNGEGLW